jgi:DNA-binding MarR family transcriptional regulator
VSGPANEAPPPGAVAEIDRVIHEPARFTIMANLYVVEKADFTFLLNQTGLTRGNLSSHMSKLEEAGYIAVEKKFVARKPLTVLRLTDAGREAFLDYRMRMQRVLEELPK